MQIKSSRNILASLALLVAAGLPAGAQTLDIGLTTAPTSLDPHYHNHGQSSANAAHVFERLFESDARMQLVPGLATEAKSDDAVTWDVTLREDVAWQDGAPFTADDVAFSLNRASNVPNSPGSFGVFTRAIASVAVTGPHSLRIVTKAPTPLLMTNLSNIFIVSRRHGEGAATDDYNSGKAMIGTGPYRFVEWSPGTQAIYRRNDAYWREPEPWERVRFRVIPNNAARVASLLSGDTDLVADIPTTDMARLRADARFQIASVPSNRLVFLAFDRTREALATGHIAAADGSPLQTNPLGDVRVRRALSMAVNRSVLVDRINEGAAVATGQFVPEGFFGHFSDITPEAFDPESARKLLEEAGWGGGFRLTLTTSNDRIFNAPQMVQAIAQMWTRIGVQTTVELMPHAMFTPRRNRYELPVFLSSWGNSTGEPLSTLMPQLGTRARDTGLGSANRIRYSNTDLDKLLIQAAAERDTTRRLTLLRQATDMALADAIMPPLLLQVNNWGLRKGLAMEPRVDQATLAMSVRPK